jgi:hypothetical protein
MPELVRRLLHGPQKTAIPPSLCKRGGEDANDQLPLWNWTLVVQFVSLTSPLLSRTHLPLSHFVILHDAMSRHRNALSQYCTNLFALHFYVWHTSDSQSFLPVIFGKYI